MEFFKKIIKQFKIKIRGEPEKIKPSEQKIIINNEQLKNLKNMAIFNYGVGGNEIKVDANEAIQDIQQNKALLVSKLTEEEPISPEIVTGLKTVEDVFKHFNPSIKVEHETADGQLKDENFSFSNLGDFTPKSLIKKSEFLNNLNIEQAQYSSIIKQLRNNKVLNNFLSNPEAKDEFINELRAIANEIENNNL
jgi:hypothetical protein